MVSDVGQSTKRIKVVSFRTLIVIAVLWVLVGIGRVLTNTAPWGPEIGGRLPNGNEVYFQARPGGFETDDRLTVIAPNTAPQHYMVDQVHGGFEYVVLKYNNTGNQLWVESDGKVGASIDLTTNDFRAEHDTQHSWAEYGTGTTLDSGNTSSPWSLFSLW